MRNFLKDYFILLALVNTKIASGLNSSLDFNDTVNVRGGLNQTSPQQLLLGLPIHSVAITITMYSFIFLIGFFGNALVIFVVCWNKSLQHNTNYCLVNLSVADLLLIIVCMPSAIMDLFAKEVWYFGYIMCKIIPWLEHTIAHASILTIVAISVERSLAIVFPLKAIRVFTKRRLFLVVLLIWIFSSLYSMPIMTATIYKKVKHREFGRLVNVCSTKIDQTWQLVYLFLSLFLFYMLPCILLFVLYGKIVYVIKNRNLNTALVDRSESSKATFYRPVSKREKLQITEKDESLLQTEEILKSNEFEHRSTIRRANNNNNQNCHKNLPQINQKQIIFLLIIMMFLILLLLLPYRVFSIWITMATIQQLRDLGFANYFTLLNFCRVTFYLNSAINPIFYHLLSSKFQNAFRNVFKKKSNPCKRPGNSSFKAVNHV